MESVTGEFLALASMEKCHPVVLRNQFRNSAVKTMSIYLLKSWCNLEGISAASLRVEQSFKSVLHIYLLYLSIYLFCPIYLSLYNNPVILALWLTSAPRVPLFDVICDLLLNRRMATWNIFVKSLLFYPIFLSIYPILSLLFYPSIYLSIYSILFYQAILSTSSRF